VLDVFLQDLELIVHLGRVFGHNLIEGLGPSLEITIFLKSGFDSENLSCNQFSIILFNNFDVSIDIDDVFIEDEIA
jgi:hypothetical protein